MRFTILFSIFSFALLFLFSCSTAPQPVEKELTLVFETEPTEDNPVTWTWGTQQISADTFELVFGAKIFDGWTLYSQYIDEDAGPIPTTFEFDAGDHFQMEGKLKEKGKIKSGIDPVFGTELTKFIKGTAWFKKRIFVADQNQPITGYLTFMTCNDRMCLPPQDIDFKFALTEAAQAVVTTTGTGTDLADYPLEDVAFDKSNATISCTNEEEEEERTGLLWTFILGFGGGLVALLTPCVFPMIPLTVGFFTKRSETRAKGIRNAFTYGFSIIGIYVTLGMIVTLAFGADALNLLSTDPILNITFAILFLVFALSFFGLFEINLPSSWVNKSEQLSDKGGLLGIFFMAFTLSLVSFSCTGPIIGTLLVETATGNGPQLFGRIPVGPMVGMLGFSTALALPFGLFAAFPSWLNALPKSGGWMSDIKVTLGFIEVALALKFLSVADLILDTKFLPYEAFVAVWVLCSLGLALYYFGFLKFPVNYTLPKRTVPKAFIGIASLALAIIFGMGFRYNTEKATFMTPSLLSGIAPPAKHTYIYPSKKTLNLSEHYLTLEAGIEKAKAVQKPILLDFTGHGCVNCRKMEDNVWSKAGIYETIKDSFVVVSLYVDDRTKLEQPYASPIDGKVRKTAGNIWADLQYLEFQKQSQPYYVLLSPEGDVLNKPVAYTPNKEEYQAFLECGLHQFVMNN